MADVLIVFSLRDASLDDAQALLDLLAETPQKT